MPEVTNPGSATQSTPKPSLYSTNPLSIIGPSNFYLVLSFEAQKNNGTTKKLFFTLGTVNSITFRTIRRKAPIYALGNKDPIGIGRGVRQIEGSLRNVMLDSSLILKYFYTSFIDSDKAMPISIALTNQQYNWISSDYENTFDAMKKQLKDTYNLQIDDVEIYSVKATSTDFSGGEIQQLLTPIFLDQVTGSNLYIIGLAETASANLSSDTVPPATWIGDSTKGTEGYVAALIEDIEFTDTIWRVATNQTIATERLDFFAKSVTPFGMTTITKLKQ